MSCLEWGISLVLSGDSKFILQSLTTSKMRKTQTKKLSQLHKAKTCWTKNSWSSGIMSNFWGQVFYVLGGKKSFFFSYIFNFILCCFFCSQKFLIIPLHQPFLVQQVFALCNWDSFTVWNFLIFEVVKLCKMKKYPPDSTLIYVHCTYINS